MAALAKSTSDRSNVAAVNADVEQFAIRQFIQLVADSTCVIPTADVADDFHDRYPSKAQIYWIVI